MDIGNLLLTGVLITLVWIGYAIWNIPHPTPKCPVVLKPDHHYIAIPESQMQSITNPRVTCITIQGPVTYHDRVVWVCARRKYGV